jgi:two-component system response regulator
VNSRPVLYAEDEENDAFFLGRAFKAAGIAHPLVVVPDGREAIDYCLGRGAYAGRPDHVLPCLVLLDLNLPGKSGIEVLEAIRKESAIPLVPVVVLTSSLQDSDIHLAYSRGANAYLGKPSQPDELFGIVQSLNEFWLKRNRSTVPAHLETGE